MEKQMYDEMREQQDTNWWYCGKKEIVLDFAETFGDLKKDGRQYTILDVGCGMGLMLEALEGYGDVYGVEMEGEAVEYCRINSFGDAGSDHVRQGYLPDNIPFEDGTFDRIFALDVLEHVEDDAAAAKKLHSLLKDGGRLILTVPAHMYMWSGHDVLTHHFRRYEKDGLVKVLSDAGFKVTKCSYYNSRLYLPAYLVRKIKNLLKIQESDIDVTSKVGFMNKPLEQIFAGEKNHLREKDYKNGVSLILAAEK